MSPSFGGKQSMTPATSLSSKEMPDSQYNPLHNLAAVVFSQASYSSSSTMERSQLSGSNSSSESFSGGPRVPPSSGLRRTATEMSVDDHSQSNSATQRSPVMNLTGLSSPYTAYLKPEEVVMPLPPQ
jgi:hypothetical protein